jgi:hypothetical protein
MQKIQAIFWNTQQQRLRAFWRLVGFLILVTLLSIVITVAGGLFVGLVQVSGIELPLMQMLLPLGMIVTLFAVVLGMFLASMFLDRRPFADFGFHMSTQWWLDLGFGLLLGAGLMTMIFLGEWSLGWVTITNTYQVPQEGQSFLLALLQPLIIFLCVGIYEELLSRGYLLRNIAEGLNMPRLQPQAAIIIAWIISSVVFGLGHFSNPNSSLISNINLVLAGLFLGLGYVLTRELAMPIGLHITWNFFQGNVFGFPVSGIDSFSETTFIAIEQGGPDVWTGGTFGPEAGLIGVVAILTGCLLIVGWVKVWYGDVRLQESLAHFTPRSRAKRNGD